MTLIMTKFHPKKWRKLCWGKLEDVRRRWVFREGKNREQIKKVEKYGLAWEVQADSSADRTEGPLRVVEVRNGKVACDHILEALSPFFCLWSPSGTAPCYLSGLLSFL